MTTKEVSLNEDLTQPTNQKQELEILKVTYKALANIGNYQNESIEITARANNSNKDEVLASLKSWVWSNLNSEKEYWEMGNRMEKARQELRQMQNTLAEAEKEYQKQATFFQAQGIPLKPFTPPEIKVLALPASEEVVAE